MKATLFKIFLLHICLWQANKVLLQIKSCLQTSFGFCANFKYVWLFSWHQALKRFKRFSRYSSCCASSKSFSSQIYDVIMGITSYGKSETFLILSKLQLMALFKKRLRPWFLPDLMHNSLENASLQLSRKPIKLVSLSLSILLLK